MSKLRVFVADDNTTMCDLLKSYFEEMTDNLEFCGCAGNGEEALIQIRKLLPDVLILDLVMPKLDGLSVLEDLEKHPPTKIPCIIVTSAICQEKCTAKALASGASYYMIKPYGLHDLCDRIALLASSSASEPKQSAPAPASEQTLDSLIADQVLLLGIPTKILGFHYISEAISIILEEGNVYPISKQVYAVIARNNQTSIECVESIIRKTIARIFDEKNETALTLFGGNKRPSNAEFLTTLAQNLKRERRKFA